MLIAQIYVDDIIFGATNQELCAYFVKEIQSEFEMRMMRELIFFLDLQVKQTRMKSSSTKLNTSRIC